MEKGIKYLCALDKEFPERLRSIPDRPKGIYYMGRLPDPDKPSVAIIGARNNSEYGRGAAKEFATELSKHGVQIISGMARGIDGIAQNAAVENGGASFGILGCGIDMVYPEENRELFKKILKKGGLISEYPPGMPPMAALFPPRNRIISALCDILLVIEARERSGTSITVRHALEQGKDIFALPGRITDPLSRGCNILISEGAGMAVSPRAILDALGYGPDEDDKGASKGSILLRGKNRLILDKLDLMPLSLNVLSEKTGLNAGDLMSGLMKLLLLGYAKEVSPGYYIKVMKKNENIPV